jgi:thiamine biosynthesis lipoprotein
LGTKVSLTVVHDDPRAADTALSAAFAALDRVEEVMSLYRPHSQLVRLNRQKVLADPHPDLVTVLTAAEELSRRTNGAFDVTVQPLWTVFARAQRSGNAPSADEIAAAQALVDWRRVEMAAGTIRLHGSGTAVTLNGIAQGFAVDRVLQTLRQHGIDRALVDVGELGSLGRKADASAWRAGIQHPRDDDAQFAAVDLDGRCLATSGDYATPFSADRRDHHIFDPRTGRSPTELASVSVVAANGMWADGLSTALCVLGVEAGRELLASIPQADALFVSKHGDVMRTAGFPRMES